MKELDQVKQIINSMVAKSPIGAMKISSTILLNKINSIENMKLKTLKDFEAKLIDWKESQGFWVNLEQLRAEAVKWVKDREARKNYKYKGYLDVQLAIFDEQIGWIKHFFNLTEEDLK